LRKSIKKSEWTQIAFVQSDDIWQLFLDGSLQVDINDLKLDTNCAEQTPTNLNSIIIYGYLEIQRKLCDQIKNISLNLSDEKLLVLMEMKF
jgi:hypothetical protein